MGGGYTSSAHVNFNRIASDQIMTWLIKTKTEHIFGLGMVSPAWFTKDDNQSGVEINRLGQYDVLRGKICWHTTNL